MQTENVFTCTSIRLASYALDRGVPCSRHPDPLHTGRSIWRIAIEEEQTANIICDYFRSRGQSYPRSLQKCLKHLKEGNINE